MGDSQNIGRVDNLDKAINKIVEDGANFFVNREKK